MSITNPSEDSPLEYFSGKAELEKVLIESGMTYSILRPAVLFGKVDILINNIAWAIRRLPLFGVFGDGNYRLQPIYIDDFAQLAVEQGQKKPTTQSLMQYRKYLGKDIQPWRRIFPLSYEAARAMVRKAGKLAGIHLRLHDLRRRHAATFASRSGVHIEIVSKVILRQANLSTTQRYLGKVSDLEALRWMENLYG